MRAEILKYDVNAPREQGFSNQRMYPDNVIEAETRAESSEKPSVEKPAEHMIVGIDGAFVKATRSKNQRKNFEIVLGRIEVSGHQDKIFAAVRDLDDLARERVRSALRSAGRGPPPISSFFKRRHEADG